MIKGQIKEGTPEKILTQFDEYFSSAGECEKYKSLIDGMSEAVIVEDKNHNVVYANPSFAKLVALPQKDCAGRSVFDFMDAGNKKVYIKETDKGAAGESPEEQVEIISRNGKTMTVLVGATLLDNGCRIVTMSDLSKIGNLEKKFKVESEKYFHLVQKSYKEVGAIKRKLEYLNDLIMFATIDVPKAEIFSFIVSSIMSFTKADACVLRLYKRKWKGKFFIEYASGVSPEWYNKKPIEYKGSLIEKALKSGGILRVDDIQKEASYSSRELARKNNFTSLVIAPIDLKTKLIGYVSIYFKNKENLELLDQDFLTVFLKQSAIAIELNS
ncbi:PAS domain-containing protein [Candidatus Peregrinibacteria bacterium]|nr:PAS domain-containing protein [Candidatus Peregrinibacteria bacterium]